MKTRQDQWELEKKNADPNVNRIEEGIGTIAKTKYPSIKKLRKVKEVGK